MRKRALGKRVDNLFRTVVGKQDSNQSKGRQRQSVLSLILKEIAPMLKKHNKSEVLTS